MSKLRFFEALLYVFYVIAMYELGQYVGEHVVVMWK
jgi:hypothetical protein